MAKELEEETTTAQIKGYLSNKKMSLDPYKAKRKDEKPWYLKSMKELKESTLVELSNQKKILQEEEARDINKKIVDISNKLNNKYGINVVKNPNYKSFIKIYSNYVRGKASEQEKDFIENVFLDKYNGNILKYVEDRILTPRNVQFSGIENEKLKNKILSFMKKEYPDVKVGKDFSSWQYLSKDLLSDLKKEVTQGNVSLTRKPGMAPKVEKPKMRVRAGKPTGGSRVSKTPHLDPEKEPEGEKDIDQIEKTVRQTEKGPLPIGFAKEDLKNVYTKLMDEMLYGKKGLATDLIDHLHSKYKEKAVDLRSVIQRSLGGKKVKDLRQLGTELGIKLVSSKRGEYMPAEREALEELVNRLDPEWHAEKAVESKGYSKLEKALEPYVKKHYKQFGYDVPEGYEDSGLVTDEALSVLAKLTKSSKEDAANYFASLRSRDPSQYRKEKGKVITIMRKSGFEDAAQKEVAMDKRRERASSEEEGGGEPKQVKLSAKTPEELSALTKGALQKMYGATAPEDIEKEPEPELARQAAEETAEKKRAAKAKHQRRQRSLEKELEKEREKKRSMSVPKKRARGFSFKDIPKPLSQESISLKEIVLGLDGERLKCEPEEKEWHTAELVYDKEKGKTKKMSLKKLMVRNDERLKKMKSKKCEVEE